MSAFTEPEAGAVYISAIAVDPAFHHSGLGQKLIKFAENFGKTKNAKYVRFDARKDNAPLMRFYERQGYKEVGIIDEDGELYALMEKQLEQV